MSKPSVRLGAALFAGILALSACGGEEDPGTPALDRIEVRAPAELPVGRTARLSATAHFTDGASRSINAEATWASRTPEVASIVSEGESRGTVEALAAGEAELEVQWGGGSARVTLAVTARELVALEIRGAPESAVPAGRSVTLEAWGTFTDGAIEEVTAQADWKVRSGEAATVGTTPGELLAVADGAAVVETAFGGLTAEVTVEVAPAALERLELDPPALSLALGTGVKVTATGILTDGGREQMSGAVQWTSADPQVATVAGGWVEAVSQGATFVTAQIDGKEAKVEVSVTGAMLAELSLTPPAASLPRGLQATLVATGRFTDDSVQELTAQVTWSSVDPAVAAVSSTVPGEVVAVGEGETFIEARFGDAVAIAPITVTPAQLQTLQLTPFAPELPKLTSVQLQATGVYTDSQVVDLTTQVAWTSSDPAVAGIDAAGVVTGKAEGTAVITAAFGGKTPSTVVTVSRAQLTGISLSGDTSLPKGHTTKLVATGTFADSSVRDISHEVVWSSSDAQVAAVSNAPGTAGTLTALAPGSAVVAASLQGKTSSVPVEITAAVLEQIELNPAAPALAKGTWTQLMATGIYSDQTTQDITEQATWSSADPLVAAVSTSTGTRGRLSALSEGTTVISATWIGITATVQAAVTPAELVSVDVAPGAASLPRGTSTALTATGTWTDGSVQDVTAQVAWASSDPAVAQVSNATGTRGEVTAATEGAATVTATLSGVSGTCAVTVTPAVLVSVQVSPASASIPKGTAQAFTATGTYSDGSQQDLTAQAAWSASGAEASITTGGTTPGVAKGEQEGQVTLTASIQGQSAQAQLTVTAAVLTSVSLTPQAPSAAQGTTRPFTLTGTWSDGSSQDVTAGALWTSFDPSVATISNANGSQGLATAVAPGQTTISASYNQMSASTVLTVTGGTLVAIDVLPQIASSPKGTTRQFFAVGYFSDGSSQDLTHQVTWSSSQVAVATISNATGSRGLATAVSEGTSGITAVMGQVSGSSSFTVTPPALAFISVTPQDATVGSGATVSLTATGYYSDSSSVDLTAQATWTSAAPLVATVEDGAGVKGMVIGLSEGTAEITASFDGKAGTAEVTVQP